MENIYISCNKEIFGPINHETLHQWLKENRLNYNDWVWIPDSQDWFPVIEIPQLTSYFYSVEDKPKFNPQNTDISSLEKGTKLYVETQKINFGGEEIEKRRFKRHSIDIPIIYQVYKEFSDKIDEEIFESITLDLSEAGAGFLSDRDFEIGTELELKLEIFPDEFKSLAKVMRSIPFNDKFIIGAKFTKVLPGQIKKLKDFLSSV